MPGKASEPGDRFCIWNSLPCAEAEGREGEAAEQTALGNHIAGVRGKA